VRVILFVYYVFTQVYIFFIISNTKSNVQISEVVHYRCVKLPSYDYFSFRLSFCSSSTALSAYLAVTLCALILWFYTLKRDDKDKDKKGKSIMHRCEEERFLHYDFFFHSILLS